MSTKQDGGQAFPSEFFETEHGDRVEAFAGSPGMSLRDWFAGQAIGAVAAAVYSMPEARLEQNAATEGYVGSIDGFIAMRCAKIADAMLAERSKP